MKTIMNIHEAIERLSYSEDKCLSAECRDALNIIMSYWTTVASCDVDMSRGMILVDSFHNNLTYILRSPLISKYLQVLTGRSWIGLLGTPV